MLGFIIFALNVILISAQCGVFVNMDINSSNIGTAPVSSAADCCTKCSNFAGCLAGVFNQGQCYFKSQSTGMVAHTGATVMVPPPDPPPDPSCKSYSDNDYTGATQIGVVDSPSSQVCCAECKKTSGCTAGVYYQQKCYLKSGKGQTVSSPGKVTVMVGSSPSPSPSPTDCPSFTPYKPQSEAPPLLTSTDGSCGCADAPCQGVTPRFNWIMTMCNSPSNRCPTAGDNGCACSSTNYKNKTKVNLNYIAGYQLTYNGASWVWQLEPSSSLNLVQGSGSVYTMNNSKQMVFDAAAKVNDFANLPNENDVRKNPPPENKRVVNSLSGGGGDWDLAVFPYSTPGLSPPGMLYVFSGRLQAAAWFMLNQGTLDRGPNKATCPSTDNCWSKGSSGEIDFLEAPLLFGDYKTWDTNSDRKMWATTYNGAGRCFNQNVMQGSQCNPDGYCIANPLYQNGTESGTGDMFYTNYFSQGAGGPYSLFNYNWDDGKEHIWAAVVDFRGAFLYRDPIWPGLTSTTAAAVLTSLSPDLSTPMTAGSCGDPIVYPDPSIRSLPCVLYLASGPLLLSQEQWDKATQLVTDRPAGWTQRYIYSGADEVANFWNTGAVQCKSEVWWNLFIDTLQVNVPPTTYGVIYTKSMLQNNQPIIIPGYRKDINSSWQGIVKDNAGNVQSVQEGRLDYSCLPGTHGSFVNCPYSGQITWAQAYLKYSPEGMNVDLCGGGAGCCKCSQDKYYSVLTTNACPKACSQSTFLDALQLPNHLGCAVTMPACPLSSQPAGCAPMGPYGYSAKGNQCAFPGICPIETCFTAVGSNNWPWPDPDARRP